MRCSQQPRKAMEFEREKVRESEGKIEVYSRVVRHRFVCKRCTAARGTIRAVLFVTAKRPRRPIGTCRGCVPRSGVAARREERYRVTALIRECYWP